MEGVANKIASVAKQQAMEYRVRKCRGVPCPIIHRNDVGQLKTTPARWRARRCHPRVCVSGVVSFHNEPWQKAVRSQ